jgi:hypothetical protein
MEISNAKIQISNYGYAARSHLWIAKLLGIVKLVESRPDRALSMHQSIDKFTSRSHGSTSDLLKVAILYLVFGF